MTVEFHLRTIRTKLSVHSSREILNCIFPQSGNLDNLQMTAREKEIFVLNKQGKSLHEIARILNISQSTIKNHTANMFIKNNCKSMLELMAVYYGEKGGIMRESNRRESEDIFRQTLLKKLPPVIARKDIEIHLGGTVAKKTLANADSLGKGPKGAYAVGRNIVYPTKELVNWIIARFGITHVESNLNDL